ncbi:MAG: hypothetical protein ACO1QB_18610 [Verrucomicrobiales bacterium]
MTKKVLHLEEKGQAIRNRKMTHRDSRYVSGGLPAFYIAPTPLEQLLLNPLASATNAA